MSWELLEELYELKTKRETEFISICISKLYKIFININLLYNEHKEKIWILKKRYWMILYLL